MPYILEVQKYHCMGHLRWNGNSQHVGYMNMVFETREDAAMYYDMHNPHMRRLNALETWCSDWDPHNCLMYIVRERFHECLTIPPFQKAN